MTTTTEHGDAALLRAAARLVITNQLGSIALLERTYNIGHERASRLMDQLEAHGIVGPVRAARSREVLAKGDQADQAITSMGLGDPR